MIHKTAEAGRPMPSGLWQYVPQGSVIRQWVEDLKRVSAVPFSSTDWAIVGHGVIVEHNDSDEVRSH